MRGHRSDFDRWVADFGATGWSYREVLPLFERSERNEELTAREPHRQAGAHARRILVENGRAVGVEHANGLARAAREVILAAGAYASPQLPMLSGIGPAEHLPPA